MANPVFISYRRSDTTGEAGRLADALESLLGAACVFRDADDIPAGEDFEGHGALQVQLGGQIDHRHVPAADLPLDAVIGDAGTGAKGGDGGGGVGHQYLVVKWTGIGGMISA